MSFSPEDFPTRFDFNEAQERIYRNWEEGGYFHAEPDSDREPFSIVIPPPNVTGALHLGHALNNTLQDVLIRMKRMQGFNTLWMPGTDHAGIATQAVVERRLREEEGLSRHDLGREELVKRIWSWKEQYETRILSQLKQMGCSCDWERTRFTLDDTCAKAVRYTFFDLFKQKKIYRGKRLVNWDTFLQTAVSDDEVFQESVKGHFWHLKYQVLDPKPGEPSHVTIATTRPETMLGDTAVAVHPNPAKALDRVEAELVEKLERASDKEREGAQEQLDALRQRRTEMLPQLERLRDMANDGRLLMLPLLEREIPLVADQWAKPELGSGCVKITPAHDPNDYEVGIRCSLPMINILNTDGTINADGGQYEGLTIKEARTRVVDDLERDDLLALTEERDIELPYSDRSKTAIEPFLADQWFVRMDELAQSAINAVEDQRVTIRPSRYGKGYVDWLSEKRDWPVSRQLWWGHRIPVWSQVCQNERRYNELTTMLESDEDVASGRVAFQIERDPEREIAERTDHTVKGASKVKLPFATIHICIRALDDELDEKYTRCGYVRETDVLDTWFSSALWPHSTLGWPDENDALKQFYPTNTLITSRDIITLWVARMVLTGLNNMGEVPFKDVFIHPKILDGYGETMSKSKGNGIDPLDVIEKFGADALRFGMAHLTTETQDVRLPVQFECPHCEASFEQTKKNRELPRVACPKCKKEFSTQWAREEVDLAFPRGAVVSEKFEVARNFCNKLWNASRFACLNLDNYSPDAVNDDELSIEDRWILSRLSTVTQIVTESLESYRYAEASRQIYDFAWDEFCSFYLEMLKSRFQDPDKKQVAQRLLAHTLDSLLRLLHPIIPFITEEIWSHLGKLAPARGLTEPKEAEPSLIAAQWPVAIKEHQDSEIESRFEKFQLTLGALREVRSRQNIGHKNRLEFYVRCGKDISDLLKPMELYFESMANAKPIEWGSKITAPKTNATISLPDMDIYVDLKDYIDVEAETARLRKEQAKMAGMITGKEKKLSNASFVERAPVEVVKRERESLEQLREQLKTIEDALNDMNALA